MNSLALTSSTRLGSIIKKQFYFSFLPFFEKIVSVFVCWQWINTRTLSADSVKVFHVGQDRKAEGKIIAKIKKEVLGERLHNINLSLCFCSSGSFEKRDSCSSDYFPDEWKMGKFLLLRAPICDCVCIVVLWEFISMANVNTPHVCDYHRSPCCVE